MSKVLDKDMLLIPIQEFTKQYMMLLNSHESLRAQNAALLEDHGKMKEALEYCAEPGTYHMNGLCSKCQTDVQNWGNYIARETLENLKVNHD